MNSLVLSGPFRRQDMQTRKQIGITFLVGWIAMVLPASGVVISTDDGTANVSAPIDDPGFSNVGSRGGGSAVYLGNRWVITASHVGAGAVDFGPEIGEYPNVLEATLKLPNPSELNLKTSHADILLLRLEEEPPLPALRLPCRSVTLGSEVVMIGAGRDRLVDETYWKVTVRPGDDDDVWKELENSSGSNRHGYLTSNNRTLRWGNNLVSRTSFPANSGFGDIESFETSFAQSLPVEDLAQAVRGDSGGAVFQLNESVWELVGMIHAVSQFENQPADTEKGLAAIFGQVTFVADLHAYAESLRELADFEPARGDLNGDGLFTEFDIDVIQTAIHNGQDNCHYDLTGDNLVDVADRDALLQAAGTLLGDADLNGRVAFEDFLRLSNTFAQDGGWGDGDFDGDGEVGFADFLQLSRNFGQEFVQIPEMISSGAMGSASAPARFSGDVNAPASVPEPSTLWLTSVLLGLLMSLRGSKDR